MENFCSDEVKELAGAMLKVQAEINPAIKDASNPFAKSRYATLNSVISASREALVNNGIWVVQYPVPVEPSHLGLITKLTHATSGQWQSCLMVMPLSKIDPQGYGSALTYARRYSLASMVGLITEDDDAEAACGRARNGYNESKFKKDPTPTPTEKTNVANSEVAPKPSDSEPGLPADLPSLNGINYQAVKSSDGRVCVVATGNTLNNKSSLSANGFRWNPDRRVWWRYSDAA
jgi:hypothetical protein